MIKMTKYSPSQLETFTDCALKHKYRYGRKLRPIEEKIPPNLASGRAVHTCIEWAFALTNPSKIVGETNLHRAALAIDLSDEVVVKKYMPGVQRALSHIPDWVWEAKWHVEEGVSISLGQGNELGGRPDLWRVVEDELQPYVQILDIKTTDHDPLDYVLWSPQLRMYAMMLSATYPELPIEYQYLCVPTSTKPAKISAPRIFTRRALALTSQQVYGTIRKVEQSDASPREGRHCAYCDYNIICRARITGADVEGTIKDFYAAKE